MDTNRTPVRPGRIVAAVAGASLLLTGVTCLAAAPATAAPAPATAAPATATPLGFSVSALAATRDGGVIAVGNTFDDDLGTTTPHAALVRNGHATEITGLPATDADLEAVALTASDGDAAVLVGSGTDSEGAQVGMAWSVDLTRDPLTVEAVDDGPVGWNAIDGVAYPADGPAVLTGTKDVDGDENAVLWTAEDGEVTLADNGSPTAVAIGTVGDAPAAFVIGTDFGDVADSSDDVSALWVVQGTEATAYPLDGDARSVAFADGHVFVGETAGDWGRIVEIDAATGDRTATAAFGDGDEGIAGSVGGLAASADGTVLFAAAGYGLYAIPVAHFAEFDAERASSIAADDYLGMLAVSEQDEQTTAFSTGGDDTVVRFGAPEKPTVTAAADDYDPTALDLTISGDATGDRATVTPAGGAPVDAALEYCSYDESADSTSCSIGALARGVVYGVVVTRTNILGSTSSDVVTTRTPGELAGPSSVTFTGSAAVGSTVTAVVGSGWPAGTAFTYEWIYGGEGFGGLAGVGPTYKITPNLASLKLWLRVTGRKGGDLHTASSALVVVKAAPSKHLPVLQVRNKKATPKITGKPKVGKTVTATVSAWPKGTKVRFQWYVNGKPIKGATKKHLKLTKKLKGKRITVVATGTKRGYAPAVKKSKPIRVR